MATQLEVLKDTYETMDTSQKKEFITKLGEQLKGNKNAAYTKFLAECIQDYNREIRINTSITKTGKSDIQVNNFYGVTDVQSQDDSKKIHVPSLVLSIIGLVFFYGILSWAGLPCSIIGLVMAVKKRHIYNTKAALIMSIVALSIQALFFVIAFNASFMYYF